MANWVKQSPVPQDRALCKYLQAVPIICAASGKSSRFPQKQKGFFLAEWVHLLLVWLKYFSNMTNPIWPARNNSFFSPSNEAVLWQTLSLQIPHGSALSPVKGLSFRISVLFLSRQPCHPDEAPKPPEWGTWPSLPKLNSAPTSLPCSESPHCSPLIAGDLRGDAKVNNASNYSLF